MRISDWSSDVCSSDLPIHIPTGLVSRAPQACFSHVDVSRSERGNHLLNDWRGNMHLVIGPSHCSRRIHHHLIAWEVVNERKACRQHLAGHPQHGLRVGVCGEYIHVGERLRSEEHTSELQSLMRISYAVFC